MKKNYFWIGWILYLLAAIIVVLGIWNHFHIKNEWKEEQNDEVIWKDTINANQNCDE